VSFVIHSYCTLAITHTCTQGHTHTYRHTHTHTHTHTHSLTHTHTHTHSHTHTHTHSQQNQQLGPYPEAEEVMEDDAQPLFAQQQQQQQHPSSSRAPPITQPSSAPTWGAVHEKGGILEEEGAPVEQVGLLVGVGCGCG